MIVSKVQKPPKINRIVVIPPQASAAKAANAPGATAVKNAAVPQA
jgi:hypothetical protein